jgi:hypothetical protein
MMVKIDGNARVVAPSDVILSTDFIAAILGACVQKRYPWVEDVTVVGKPPEVIHVMVEHSYPEGVDVHNDLAEIVRRSLPVCVGYTMTTKRVPYGRGQLEERVKWAKKVVRQIERDLECQKT